MNRVKIYSDENELQSGVFQLSHSYVVLAQTVSQYQPSGPKCRFKIFQGVGLIDSLQRLIPKVVNLHK